MAERYLLDTSTASYIIRGNPPQVRQRLCKIPIEMLAVSTITEADLRIGCARRPETIGILMAVEAFLLRVDVLAWDRAAARCYGRLRADSAVSGITLGAMDMLIAAHALSIGAVLVSHDAAFRRLSQLRVEDWAAS